MTVWTRQCVFAVWLIAAVFTLSACTSSSGGGGSSGDKVIATPGKGKITIEWDDTGAESYTLSYSNGNGSEASAPRQIAISGAISGATSPYEHDYLIYGEDYTYTVFALDSAGNSSTVGSDSATPDRLPLDEIEFADENFEACVNGSTQDGEENAGAEFADEIDTLTKQGGLPETDPLACWSANNGDVEGVEWLTSLVELNLSDNPLSDVTPLRTLIALTSLSLQDMDGGLMTGIASLVTLVNAEEIVLSGNSTELPCEDFQTLINALGADVVTPEYDPGFTCFSGT